MMLYDSGVYLVNGNELIADGNDALAAVKSKTGVEITKEQAAENTMSIFLSVSASGRKFSSHSLLTKLTISVSVTLSWRLDDSAFRNSIICCRSLFRRSMLEMIIRFRE